VVVLIIVIATASVVIGFAGGRWVIPPLLAGAWILYVAGREQEWWGSGVGEAAGVVARRRIKRAAPRSSRPDLPRRAFKGEP
jgi:hypothetical protein